MAGLVIPYSAPIVEVPGTSGSPLLHPYTANTHCNDGDIVTLGVNVAGEIDPAVTNDGTNELLGVVQGDSDAVYAQNDTGMQGVFGYSPVSGGALAPEINSQILVALFNAPGAIVAMNLRSNTGWVTGGNFQANIGTQCGLYKDPTTGLYVLDTQAANKVCTIVGKVQGVTTEIINSQAAQPFGVGNAGDLAARVYVQFLSGALAAAGGL